ncbi:hypothetical protein RU93_GL002059 [Enterococcus aquimarinus]|uniref:Uncharacterized protein n=1 Tax=Enterococcus aquimarinus TaxID=328396 RepID=A0A1L8QSQ1_9ENTE|nr:hypothetical protein RU93_GL002059 [Enterococcus aquimarinus]
MISFITSVSVTYRLLSRLQPNRFILLINPVKKRHPSQMNLI